MQKTLKSLANKIAYYASQKVKAMFVTFISTIVNAIFTILGTSFDERLEEVLSWCKGFEDRLFPIMWIHPYEENIFDKVKECADRLYNELQSKGLEVIYDDRKTSAGVMFSDADLLGVPVRVVVSPRNLKENCCEITARDKSFSYKVPVEETKDKVLEIIKELMDKANS